MYRDYGPKGVKFFYVYKSLAHPELRATNLVQPFTMDERLAHAQLAEKQLQGSIPWLVDAIDNRLKRALGDRPNSEFIIDPSGKIVRKRAWSDPAAVRQDLEELVGKAETLTKPEDVGTRDLMAAAAPANNNPTERLPRGGLFPLITNPLMQADTPPFYVKLRCEADLSVIDHGQGKLYLGFYPDPLYHVHWNNLIEPLRFKLDVPAGVELSQSDGESSRRTEPTDTQPREFLLSVNSWPKEKALRLTVSYSACTENNCYVVEQQYVIQRSRDIDGGAAPTAAFRGLTAEEMLKLLLSGDNDRDGKLTRAELNSIQRPRFTDYDLNSDGVLDQDEMQKVAVEMTSQKEL